uniref:Uncharacterized protein n=1 Tax=Romanomermis culicivorax TaxID=13658 RepID=A0A915K3U6_ROMCU
MLCLLISFSIFQVYCESAPLGGVTQTATTSATTEKIIYGLAEPDPNCDNYHGTYGLVPINRRGPPPPQGPPCRRGPIFP